MTENVSGQTDITEAPEVSKEELALATDVMLSMVKASKGLKMYLPNNPLLAKFLDDMAEKMKRHLARFGDFKLDIDQYELRYKGKVIYENREPKESFAFKMYFDGIRFLIFSDGIEAHELCDFLDIIGKERPGDVDDDIVTLLWEKNLPNLIYILAEDFLEFDVGGGTISGPRSQQDKINGVYRAISTESAAPSLSIVPQNILVLTEEEAEWLKRAREADEKRRPLDEVIQILTSILVGEKDQEFFEEFLQIMVTLTEKLFTLEEIRYAINLVNFLGNLGKNDQISPENRTLISNSVATILSRDVVEVLARVLDKTEVITPEELQELLTIFDKPALSRMCELLGLVEKMKMRKVLIQALISIGKDTPEVFFPYLSDPRWFVVRNMAFVLARIAHPAALEAMVSVISHREPRVRREVLNYLESTSDQKAKSYLLKFLRDDSSALRIRTLQVLGSSRHAFALKPIAALAAAEQFQEKEMDEKKAVYEALGELGGDQMLPMFREMMLKKFWFNKAKEKESVILAVAGLLKIRSEAALSLLEETARAKSDDLREIIGHAAAACSAEIRGKKPQPEEKH